MKTFREWLKIKEMAGTSVVMGNKCVKSAGPDAQIWGNPCGSAKKMKSKKP